MAEFIAALKKKDGTLTPPKAWKESGLVSVDGFTVFGRNSLPGEGRWSCVLNGEVTPEPSRPLPEGFNGFRDEALILKLLNTVGPEETPLYLNGCFSYCAYDRSQKRVWAARDRLGAKQFYYTADEEALWMSSSFLPLFEKQGKKVDPAALQHFFTFQYVPEPMTIGVGVKALTLGCVADGQDDLTARRFRIWKPEPDNGKDHEMFKAEIRQAMTEATHDSLAGAKTVAAFLSGGLDSSILAALAAKEYPDMTAYTIAYDVPGFSEAEAADHSCQKYGIRHEIVKIDSQGFREAFPEVMKATGVPVGDPSATAVYMIARAAAGKTDVIISGEGSDELWGGYHTYRPSSIVKKISSLPGWLKKGLWGVGKLLPEGVKGRGALERGCTPLKDRYVGNTFVCTEKDKKKLLKNYDPSVKFTDITAPYFEEAAGLNDMDQMQYIDVMIWLPGDIDVVAGKLCSVHGLKVVTPFMDNRVTDLARKLSYDDKLSAVQNKVILREVFRDDLTDEVVNGIKKGYPVPVRYWIRNELYDWAADLIRRAPVDDWINKDTALAWLKECRGKENDTYFYRKVWAVVSFCQWAESNLG